MEKRKTILGFLKTATWICAIITCLLYFYVNQFMPHGPMINMGEECYEYNDGRSTACADRYVEDTRRLNIPDWAKFLRDDESTWIFIYLALFVFFEYKLKDDEYSWPNLRDK